jgi:hypothetical protein
MKSPFAESLPPAGIAQPMRATKADFAAHKTYPQPRIEIRRLLPFGHAAPSFSGLPGRSKAALGPAPQYRDLSASPGFAYARWR